MKKIILLFLFLPLLTQIHAQDINIREFFSLGEYWNNIKDDYRDEEITTTIVENSRGFLYKVKTAPEESITYVVNELDMIVGTIYELKDAKKAFRLGTLLSKDPNFISSNANKDGVTAKFSYSPKYTILLSFKVLNGTITMITYFEEIK